MTSGPRAPEHAQLPLFQGEDGLAPCGGPGEPTGTSAADDVVNEKPNPSVEERLLAQLIAISVTEFREAKGAPVRERAALHLARGGRIGPFVRVLR